MVSIYLLELKLKYIKFFSQKKKVSKQELPFTSLLLIKY